MAQYIDQNKLMEMATHKATELIEADYTQTKSVMAMLEVVLDEPTEFVITEGFIEEFLKSYRRRNHLNDLLVYREEPDELTKAYRDGVEGTCEVLLRTLKEFNQ